MHSQKLKNTRPDVNLFIWDSCKLTNQYELYFNWCMYWHKIRLIRRRRRKKQSHRFQRVYMAFYLSSVLFLSISVCVFMSFHREKWCEKKTLYPGRLSRKYCTIYSNGVIEMTYDVRISRCLLDSSSSSSTKTIRRSHLIASKVIERMTDRWIDRMLNLLCLWL